jgi:thiamine-monophosphate kinase
MSCPFISMPRKPARLTGENRLIQILQNRYQDRHPLIDKGIGDDAAVLRLRHSEERWLVTTDMLLENIDFRRKWISSGSLGFKSLAVNLSDLAAMGARPRFYTVSLALPPEISERWILGFYDGLTELGTSVGARLIGGDFSRSPKGICISITALGESLNRKVLYRSGARAGDLLYVTGTLGRSAAGLRLLKTGRRIRSRPQRDAIQAHRKPEPRCEPGLWLAQSGLVRCMMDLSDGLSVDLPRMCAASAVGAEINAAELPVFKESVRWGCDPVDLALHGGEDFELLIAVPDSKARLLEQSYPSRFPGITRIGRLIGGPSRVWIHSPGKSPCRLPERGYDHFRRVRRAGHAD